MTLFQINHFLDKFVPQDGGNYKQTVFASQFNERFFRTTVLEYNLQQKESNLICTYNIDVKQGSLLTSLTNDNNKPLRYVMLIVGYIFAAFIFWKNSPDPTSYYTVGCMALFACIVKGSWQHVEKECRTVDITLNFATFSQPKLDCYNNECDNDGNLIDPTSKEIISMDAIESPRYICFKGYLMSSYGCIKLLFDHPTVKDKYKKTIYFDPTGDDDFKYLTGTETNKLKSALTRIFGHRAVKLIKSKFSVDEKLRKFKKLFDEERLQASCRSLVKS